MKTSSLSYIARDLTVRRSFESDVLLSPDSGKLGQKGWSLLSSSLQDTVPRLIEKPDLHRSDCSLGETRIFTLAEAIVHKECFGTTFSATASANFETTPSAAADIGSAVRQATNAATLNLLKSRYFSEESIVAYLQSPVLGKKRALVTHAAQKSSCHTGVHLCVCSVHICATFKYHLCTSPLNRYLQVAQWSRAQGHLLLNAAQKVFTPPAASTVNGRSTK